MNKLFAMSKITADFIKQNATLGKRAIYHLLSYLFSLIFTVSPIFLAANLLISEDYMFISIGIIAVSIFMFLYLADVFYYLSFKIHFKDQNLIIRYNLILMMFLYLFIAILGFLAALLIIGVLFIW